MLSEKFILERIACRNPAPSGAGQGKLFNKRKAANSRFGSKRFGRISSFQGGVLQKEGFRAKIEMAKPQRTQGLVLIDLDNRAKETTTELGGEILFLLKAFDKIAFLAWSSLYVKQ